MKTLNSKIICLVIAACSFAACKKDNKEPIKPEPEKPMVVAIDGKEYTVDKNAVKTTHYTDAGAATSAVDVIVPLDNTGRTIKFYIADLKPAPFHYHQK